MQQLLPEAFDLTSIMLDKKTAESNSSVLFTQTSKIILAHY